MLNKQINIKFDLWISKALNSYNNLYKIKIINRSYVIFDYFDLYQSFTLFIELLM